MGNKFIRNYIAKKVAGRSDDGIMITLSDPKKIDFQVAMMEDLLMRNGIDPRAITSENQFKGILNLLESNVKPNCEKMSSHINFVESVYNNIKEPMYYVCSQIRGLGSFRYLGLRSFRYLSN